MESESSIPEISGDVPNVRTEEEESSACGDVPSTSSNPMFDVFSLMQYLGALSCEAQ